MGEVELAGALRRWRERAGLTQQDLADRAGLSVGGLRDLEQGRVTAPRPATLRRLALALALSDMEAEEFFGLGRRSRPPAYDLQVWVLGPLAASVDGRSVDLGSARQRTLLALLALTPNVPVPRDTLVDALWGGRPPGNAAGLLQNQVSRLRERLRSGRPATRPDRLLVATHGGYRLALSDDQLDLLEFRRFAGQARRAHQDGDLASAHECYRRATAIWRGAPVADVPGLRVLPEVAALERERQSAIVEYADVAAALGRHDQVLPLLRQATEADPLDEAAHARLILALAGNGQQAAALQVFEALRRRLADELGVDPGPDLAGAHRRVLRQEVTRPAGTVPAVQAHRQLPLDIADFTGREAELRALWSTLPPPGAAGSTPTIYAIEGMAGVGKTRLAVHLAHQLVGAGRYTDVQLYVDLHGHADEPPADPATVLASFLHLLGVPSARIPDGLAARAALYRDRLHGRQAIVVLDNAASGEQVLPLLPASPTSVVLVTSRRVLALDGARALRLDVFTAQDTHALLGRVVGEDRLAADPAAARRVAELCGRLPLAVMLAAHRLRSRPAWTFGDLAARLAAADNRLGELTVGSRHIRAVFDLSYRALDPPRQRLFRLLGLHPGEDFTAESAAALAGTAPPAARQALERLVDEHLVTPVGVDRYRLHDLLGEYARSRAVEDEGEAAAAVDQVFTWYLYAADAAIRRVSPQNVDVVLDDRFRPSHLPVFDADEPAFRWLAAERTAALAAVASAAARGRHDIAWRLAAVLRQYFERHSNWHDWLGTCQIALDAARRADDPRGEALILNGIGLGYTEIDQTEQAIECFTRALEIRRAIGDRHGEGRTLNNLGITYGRWGKFHDAIEYLTAALDIRRQTASAYDQSMTLGNLGRAYAGAGQHEEAIRCLRQALDVRRRLAEPVGIAWALYNLGAGQLGAGQHQEAIISLSEARDLFRARQCFRLEAEAVELLGDALLLAGQPDRARACWQQALEVFDSLDYPQAESLRSRLGPGARHPVVNP